MYVVVGWGSSVQVHFQPQFDRFGWGAMKAQHHPPPPTQQPSLPPPQSLGYGNGRPQLSPSLFLSLKTSEGFCLSSFSVCRLISPFSPSTPFSSCPPFYPYLSILPHFPQSLTVFFVLSSFLFSFLMLPGQCRESRCGTYQSVPLSYSPPPRPPHT